MTTYPFDPTGTATTNLVTNEPHVLAANQASDYFFIIPEMAPFFRESLVVIHQPSGRTMVQGQDYVCSARFHDASMAIGKAIYGAISFFDRSLMGVAQLRYQTLGGDWTVDSDQITQILSNAAFNPRTTSWDQVANIPYAFPVIDHPWNLDDMVGAQELVGAINGIRDTIAAKYAADGESDAINLAANLAAMQMQLSWLTELIRAVATNAGQPLTNGNNTTLLTSINNIVTNKVIEINNVSMGRAKNFFFAQG